jgi:tetratricopeptide (TPR) repeat protein
MIQQLEQRVASLQAASAPTIQLVDALNELAYAYYPADVSKGMEAAQSACLLARFLGHPQGEADSLIRLSWLLIQQSKFEAAYMQAEHALYIANQLNDKGRRASSTHLLAVVHYEAGNYAKAELLWQELLAQARKDGDLKYQADFYTALGILHQEQSNLTLAYDLKLRAHEVYVEIDDPNRVISLNNLAYLLTKMGQHGKAMTYAMESLQRCSSESKSWRSTILHTLGLIQLQMHNHGEARRLLEESFSIALLINKQQAVRSLMDLAMLEWECTNRPAACDALMKALALAEEIKSIKLQSQAHQSLYRYYLQMKAYGAASHHHEQFLACDHEIGCKRMEKQVQIMRANAAVLNARPAWVRDSQSWLQAA